MTAAFVALFLGVHPAQAQEKGKEQPPVQKEPDLPPTNDPAELMRRLKAKADKMGLKTEQPKTDPVPVEAGKEAPKPSPEAAKEQQPRPVLGPTIAPAPNAPNTATPGAVKPKAGTAGAGQPIKGAPNPAAGKGVQPAPARGAAGTAGGDLGLAWGHGPDPATLAPDDVLIDIGSPEADLPNFVTFIVRDKLGLQLLFQDGGLAGQKFYLSAPIVMKETDLLPFVTMLLEQRMYTIVQDSSGIYIVQPKADIPAMVPKGGWGTTRIIHTPNIKPTALQNSITALLAAGRAGQAGIQPIYMDDLGLIIMTETPRVLNLIEDFVGRIVSERAALKFFRFDLLNISAAAAKDRVLELLGQQAQRTAGTTPGGVAAPTIVAGATAGAAGSLTNLGDRLTVDPTSNRLLLRGRNDEQSLLRDMLEVIDVPNGMDSRWYAPGTKTAMAVSAMGRAEQLGSVTEFNFDSGGSGGAGALGFGRGGAAGGSQTDSIGSGAGFTLYTDSGGFIFRGTAAQHRRVEALIKSLKDISADEVTTYEFYKLRHGKAADVAEIIQNLLSNTAGSGNRGSLLGAGLGTGSNRNTRRPNQPAGTTRTPGARPAGEATAAAAAGGGLTEIDGADVFVLADEPNNQVLVKAPAKLQPQFRQLIGKIDLRRPQVYIDAKIITVSSTDSFRLAIEAQQIIGQFAFNTNFGLGSLTSTSGSGSTTTTTGGFTSPKNVATGLGGITAALIRSRDVPLIVNALSSNIDTRIVATPQLLVDDNEEAEISSLDQQPTGTTSQSSSAGSTVTGFQDYQSAGPKLKVKPQISEGGYMRLEYSIELSAFQGAASGNLPPPKTEAKIESKSVTVPTDATIVVGGLGYYQNGNTVVRVPFLGDIPLLGNLFKDQGKSGRVSTLYVFITPKIMRDPSFADLRLLTRAPLAEVNLPAEYPPPEPESISVIDTARYAEENRLREEREKHKMPPDISPAKGAPVRKDPPISDEPQ